MDNKGFARMMSILHREYEFDLSADFVRRDWWMQNALHCLRGWIKSYAKFNPELVEEFYWEEHWGLLVSSGGLNGDPDSWFPVWDRKYPDGYRLMPGFMAATYVLIEGKRLDKNCYGVTHHWVEWGGVITWFTTPEAVDALEKPELFHELLDRGVPTKCIDEVIENIISTDSDSLVNQHKRLLKKQKKEKKKD